jgi:TPP-dependent 2-oxoacid decarboxylase
MNIWCGEMKAAEYIVKFLEEKDARIVYGLPGYNILEIYEAIRKSSLEHVLVKHEHSAAVMADVTGRLTLEARSMPSYSGTWSIKHSHRSGSSIYGSFTNATHNWTLLK